MTEQQIELAIIKKSKEMAKILYKGKDIELRKSASGVSIAEVVKKVIR